MGQELETLGRKNQRLRDITRGGTEVYHAIALLQSAVRGLCMREAEERRLQAEDEAYASRIKACCRRAIRRFIYLSARQLPRLARRGVGRWHYVTTVVSGEVLKMGAKRRRWMQRRDLLLQGQRPASAASASGVPLVRQRCFFVASSLLLLCFSSLRLSASWSRSLARVLCSLSCSAAVSLCRTRPGTDPPSARAHTHRFDARGT